jgi:hypothetical protein
MRAKTSCRTPFPEASAKTASMRKISAPDKVARTTGAESTSMSEWEQWALTVKVVMVAETTGDHEEHREVARFSTIDEAVSFSKRLIDMFLVTHRQQGVTGNDLYRRFVKFGPELQVDASLGHPVFEGWEYARKQCFQFPPVPSI